MATIAPHVSHVCPCPGDVRENVVVSVNDLLDASKGVPDADVDLARPSVAWTNIGKAFVEDRGLVDKELRIIASLDK